MARPRTTTYYKASDGIMCGVEGCKRHASRLSTNGPRCSCHNTAGVIHPSNLQEHKRTYHWKYVGIDLAYDEYLEKLAAQDNKCQVCGRDFDEFRTRPNVDHNHTTGQVRGLLCHHCNQIVGHVENGDTVKAQEYLNFWGNK